MFAIVDRANAGADRDLRRIYSIIASGEWTQRSLPMGVHIDQARGVVVLQTVSLTAAERDALDKIGGAALEVDETAHPVRR